MIFGGDAPEYPLAQRLVADEPRVMGGNMNVGLGHRHHGVVDQSLEEGPAGIEFSEQGAGSGISRGERLEGGAETVPARQVMAALHPGEIPLPAPCSENSMPA